MRSDLDTSRDELVNAPALHRIFAFLAASFRRNRRPAGRMPLVTQEEADAFGALIGERLKEGSAISVARIDRLFRERTLFESLEHALGFFRNEPPREPKLRKAIREEDWQKAWERLFGILRELNVTLTVRARVVSWVEEDKTSLRTRFTRWGRNTFLEAFRTVVSVLLIQSESNASTVYLAQLAARVTGNAKALDSDTPAGKLLMCALAYEFPEVARSDIRGRASWRTDLLAEIGIARDPISIRVDSFGLDGCHDYLTVLRRFGLTRPWNLHDLKIVEENVRAWENVAFVVENPTVFTALFERQKDLLNCAKHPTLICTNGNLNLADRRLLDALVRNGAYLFYSGDFDARGLDIATSILARYPDASNSWRMTVADYQRAVGTAERGRYAPAVLDRLRLFFNDVAMVLEDRHKLAHHENLIEVLNRDITDFVAYKIEPPRRGAGPSSASSSLVQAQR